MRHALHETLERRHKDGVAMGQDNIGKMAQGGRLKTKRVDTEAAKTGG